MLMKRPFIYLAAISLFLLVGCGKDQPAVSASTSDATASETTWLTDFEKAKSRAAESGRPVFVNFTGSDWCPPCGQLKRDIFSTEEFATYAMENLVLLELDFPQRTPQSEDLQRQNQQLAAAYEISGFPTLMLLDPDGEEIVRSVGYMPGGPKRFVAWAEAARAK